MTAVAGVAPAFEDPSPQAVYRQYVATANRRDMASNSSDASFGFADFIDVINPLHHLPGVSQLYRAAVNDQISEEASYTGKALYGFALGGPIGVGLIMAFDALSGQKGGAQEVGPAGDEPPLANDQSSPDGPENTPPSKPVKAQIVTHTGLLGEAVAVATQDAAGLPFDLTQFGNTVGSTAALEAASQLKIPELGRVTSVPDLESVEAAVKQKLPDQDELARLATHKSNHLSLDVLKILQERHAKLTASEQS